MSDAQGDQARGDEGAAVAEFVLVRQVSARLAREFRSRLSVEDILKCVAQACSDLGLRGHAALPELLERLARVRLVDRALL